MIELSPEQIRNMQLRGLEMALYFDDFCKKNRLTYFLCGGCCIGAVRSGGFVPWDDDVDVFMPRPDYERLQKLWRNTDRYSIQIPSEELYTANMFLTIHDNHTTFIKSYQKELDTNHGLMIDVLPLDGCPQGFARRTQKLWALLRSLFIVGKAPENHGRFVYWLGKIPLFFIRSWKTRCRIWRYCEKKMSRYPISECKYITELCSGPKYMPIEYPAETFARQKYMPFENVELPVPSGYDTYLRMAFGNYMELPPEEERVCHHEFEVLDLERGYREYRGKRYYLQAADKSR